MEGGQGERGRSLSDTRYGGVPPDATEDFLFHLYRGSELLQDNRVHEAKEELEQALKLQPRDAKGQDLLAVVYFRLGMYPRAIEIYEELARAFPGDPALGQNLALCYLKTGQAEKSRMLLEEVVVTQPHHLKAWSYLGLVHERLGDYHKARAAFERAQQPGMARRMEELLAAAVPPHSLSVPPMGRAAEGPFHELDGREVPLGSPVGEVAAPTSYSPPPPGVSLYPSSPSYHPPPLSRAPSQPPLYEQGAPMPPIPAAAAAPTGLSFAPTAHASNRPPSVSTAPAVPIPTVAQLARETNLRFPRDATVVHHASGMVLVQVEAMFAARGWAIRALNGDGQGFKAATLLRRARARMLDEPLGGANAPLVSLTGSGQVALACRQDFRLISLRLEDEVIYLREDSVIGFEGGLSYENGRLAVAEGDPISLLQVRGRGIVIFEARHSFASVDVTADRTAILAREAIVGWTGRLLPRELGGEEAPAGSRGLVSFVGEGLVFVSTQPVASAP
jgi:uncharacterized protein (AIM24 family)